MSDDRMFSQLMDNSRRLPELNRVPTSAAKMKVLHLSVNLPENQAEIIDRYYSLMYPTDRRATRSAIIGMALEILDQILAGDAPERMDASALDAYARTRVETHAGAHAPTRATDE